ncbi:MAG: hypothetical protein IJ806_11555 [Ruminococcus sp.]|nr:hypothetical protein [Ruminococcus sp.]
MEINVKRFLLNIGMVMALVGTFIFGCKVNDLLHTHKVSAKMTGVEYYHQYDGSDEPHPLMTFMVRGREYTRSAIETFDVQYENGKEYTVSYDSRDPYKFIAPYLYWETMFTFGVPLMLLGAVLIIRCRSAFKGYYEDFVLRYRKAFIYTLVSPLTVLFYYIWYKKFYVAPDEPFGGMAVGLWLEMLYYAVPISIVVVWVFAVLIYHINHKLNLDGAEDNVIEESKTE